MLLIILLIFRCETATSTTTSDDYLNSYVGGNIDQSQLILLIFAFFKNFYLLGLIINTASILCTISATCLGTSLSKEAEVIASTPGIFKSP